MVQFTGVYVNSILNGNLSKFEYENNGYME